MPRPPLPRHIADCAPHGRVQPPGEGPRLLHTHHGQSPPETADGAHTSSRSLRSASRGSRCSSAARNARSAGVSRTRTPSSWRSSTVIWWRKRQDLDDLPRSLIERKRSIANAFVTPK
ncbi:hypothetical protein OHU25_01715 [Streptomyces sp. NBC_00117]|uniref:hypothetical protein n=1 Tax=unclassified Streptomyces TaxID=2593676 RepID=UPI0032455C9D